MGSICNIKRAGVRAVDSDGGIAFIVRIMRTGLNNWNFELINMVSAWHTTTHSANEPSTESSHDNTEGPKHDRNPSHYSRRRMQILIEKINPRVGPTESPQRITPDREPLV